MFAQKVRPNFNPRRALWQAPLLCAALALGLGFAPAAAQAFCGFYVAKADARLFNSASKVVLARDGERTVLTMANDYRGAPEEFALVVPVPAVLQRGQINVASPSVIGHLDAYTAPRLVEYYDENPCAPQRLYRMNSAAMQLEMSTTDSSAQSAKALGVTVEAEYSVGEYDIQILSAKESAGLVTWLRQEGYKLPPGAAPIVAGYLKQGLYFFVAKVNLGEQKKLGVAHLRPLQMAYESPRFGLPIRLGTVNADGMQDLFVFALTRSGRVEAANYATHKLPSNMDLPVFVKDEFAGFYRALFDEQARQKGGAGVFLEYAWDMAWCDPCAADPLSRAELRELGVHWLPRDGGAPPLPEPLLGGSVSIANNAPDVYVTRLHLRYDGESFPEDLVFKETGNRENFQGRYILRHAWEGAASCEAAQQYRVRLRERREAEARSFATLTGAALAEVRRRAGLHGPAPAPEPWWRKLWPGQPEGE